MEKLLRHYLNHVFKVNVFRYGGGLVTRCCLYLEILWTAAHQAPLSMGILQTRIVEWIAMPSSRGPSQPEEGTQISRIAGGSFTIWTTRETQEYWSGQPIPSPGDLPKPGIKTGSNTLQADSLPAELQGSPIFALPYIK